MVMSEPNPLHDGKYQCSACDYGHGAESGKSRQAVLKHYKKTHMETEAEPEPSTPIEDETYEEEQPEPTQSEPPEVEFIPIHDEDDDEAPPWLNMDEAPADEDHVQAARLRTPIKDFLKALRTQSQTTPDREPTAAERRAERKVHHRMITWVWGGFDRLYTLWGRMMLQDKKYDFSKSPSENAILATATLDSLDYHGINPNLFLNPDIVLGVTVATFYGPETVRVVRKRRKGSGKGLLARLPIIGRFFKKKEVRPIENHTESGDRT